MNDKEQQSQIIYSKTEWTRFIPLTEWNKFHSWPPIGGLRHLVFNEKNNGFDKVIRRVGRRVLINETAFLKWVEEQDKS